MTSTSDNQCCGYPKIPDLRPFECNLSFEAKMSTTLGCPAIARLAFTSAVLACATLTVGTGAFAQSRKSPSRFPDPLPWKELLEKAPSAPSREFAPPIRPAPENDENRNNN